MRREHQPNQPKFEPREQKQRPPMFKKRIIERVSAKESAAEAKEYSSGALGRTEYEGPEGKRKAARDYVLHYAESYLRDYIFSMDEIRDQSQKSRILESALKDVEKLLSDAATEEDTLEHMWEAYPLDINDTIHSSVVRSALKELIFNMHAEYLALVRDTYQRRGLLVEKDGFSQVYMDSIEIKPEFKNGTFVIGEIRHYQSYGEHEKAPIDEVFLKNVFGIEIGEAYPLEYSKIKTDNETTSYELLIQEARQALHARIIDRGPILEEEARIHFPSIPPNRLSETIRGSHGIREAFEKKSEQVAQEGRGTFAELLRDINPEFIGIRYQERGGTKFIDGGFYPDRTGIDLFKPKGNEIYAMPVFGDDLFRITNSSSGRTETNTYLGTQIFVREIHFTGSTRPSAFYIFGSPVTRQTYERFLSNASEQWASIYSPDNHITPPDIAEALGIAEQKLNKYIARDAIIGRIVAQIYVILDSARRQLESLRDDPELSDLYKDNSQNTLSIFLEGHDTYVLVRAYIDVWRANVDPEVTDTIINVIRQRKFGDDDLIKIFHEAARSPDEWISLRRTLLRSSRDDEFLYSTLFEIIGSGSDSLGQAAGPVAEYDASKKQHIEKKYEWGITDIEVLLDRLAERQRSRAAEPLLSNEQAKNVIDSLLANNNNLNQAIVRFVPYVSDQEYLWLLAKQWSVDADDERRCDTPSPVDPFSSVPCRIIERADQGLIRRIMRDDAFSYETRLYALSMRRSLKPADHSAVQELLAEPYKKMTYEGRDLDLDRGRSAVRVETINRGILDPYVDVLTYLAAGPREIDIHVLKAAQRRLKLLDNKKT